MNAQAAIKFGKLEIDAVSYGSQGSAVLGIRDSGKTYTATLLAERLFEAGIPFIAFDPIGVWRFLRVPGTGRGYPVVVAGGQEGDLPLTVASAPEIVRAAMRNGVSLVIDLFDINLSKADWKRIVMACVRVLLHENASHGLRHVFIEEAAEFAPQRVGPDQGQVYAEIEKLARMGGNSRLGYTLINQRAEEVNKAVLELCDNLFLHRQKGRNSLTALSKWLDIGAVKDHRDIIDTLSTLPTGECWAWLAGTERPVHVKVPGKNSLHPDRRVMRGADGVKNKAAVDVGAFVQTMKATLVTVEAELQANDPKALKKRISELERQMREASAAAARGGNIPDPKVIEEAERRGYTRGKMEGYSAGIADASSELGTISAAVNIAVEAACKNIAARTAGHQAKAAALPRTAHPVRAAQPAPKPQPVRRQAPTDGTFNSQQRRVLSSLAFWLAVGHATPRREQVAAVAGYSAGSGNFNNILGGLKTMQAIDYPQPGLVSLAIAYDNDMDSAAARRMLDSVLTGPQQKILDAIRKPGGQASREQIAEASGYSAGSGNFNNLLGNLRTLRVIDYPTRGEAQIADWAQELLA